MAETIDVQVAFQAKSKKPEDQFVNTLHFANTSAFPGEWDPGDQFLTDIRNAYWTRFQFFYSNDIDGVKITAYAADAPKPRPILRQKSFAFLPPNIGAPSEVALCLSYFHDRNLPRQRGRLYLGPWCRDHAMNRPETSTLDLCLSFGADLAAIGGANIDWCLKSVKGNQYLRITDLWCDDAWDTQRRRGLGPTMRKTATTTG